MAKLIGYMLIWLVLLVSCDGHAPNRVPAESTGTAHAQGVPCENKGGGLSVENAKGLIVLSDNYGKNDSVRIYNADGSPWHQISFYGDDAKPKKSDFEPFAFHPDYFLLALKCVGRDESRYVVIVNEGTGTKKYVNANDPVLKFETWEEHILGVFAIEFDQQKNPVHEAPGGSVKRINDSKDVYFKPVEIKGEWLKIRWDRAVQMKNPERTSDYGWIKWNDNGVLLIEIYYFA